MVAPEVASAKVEPPSGTAESGDPKPSPPSTVLSSRERTVVEEYRDRITKIYKEKQPNKVDEIEKFLEKYKGQEHVLYLKICKKYTVPEEPEYRMVNPFGRGLSVLGKKLSGESSEGVLQTNPAASSKKSSDEGGPANTSPASGTAAPPVVPTQAPPVLDGGGLAKLFAPSASLLQASSPPVVGAIAALGVSPPSIGNARSEQRAVETSANKPPEAGDGASARRRSRSPRKVLSQQTVSPGMTVWAVTYYCDLGNHPNDEKQPLRNAAQVRSVAVCSSEQLAKKAAERAMGTHKVETSSSPGYKVEDFPKPSEDAACGYTVRGQSSDGKETLTATCKWLVSSHKVEGDVAA